MVHYKSQRPSMAVAYLGRRRDTAAPGGAALGAAKRLARLVPDQRDPTRIPHSFADADMIPRASSRYAAAPKMLTIRCTALPGVVALD